MNRNRFGTSLAFIDLLFNLVIASTALFLLSILMINPESKKENSTEKDAKFIVVIRWQDGSNHDVDLWGTDGRAMCGYAARQTSTMALERDDLGPDDTTTLMHFTPLNEEVISIRAYKEGYYVFGAHWYRKRDNGPAPIVRWALIDIKNYNKVIASGTKFFNHEGEEQTLLRFHMNAEGKISDIDTQNRYPILVPR